jgi:hypothetical protein
MIIAVFPSLESKQDWLIFFRREHPYCLIDMPSTLVDFQSTFLQLTCFKPDEEDAVRFTLGSRSSMEPAWQLIKGCGWSLRSVIEGLESLNFNTNVRDNSAFNIPSELSVRKSFAKEPRLSNFINPTVSNTLSAERLAQCLYAQQYDQFELLSKSFTPSLHSIMLSLSTEPQKWRIAEENFFLKASFNSQAVFRLRLKNSSTKRYLCYDKIPL